MQGLESCVVCDGAVKDSVQVNGKLFISIRMYREIGLALFR